MDKDLTVSVAESITCGLLASSIGKVSGISKWFKGGVVSYSNESKILLLKTNAEETISNNGVSKSLAIQMAKGVSELFQSDIGISTTGYAENYINKDNIEIKPICHIGIYDRINNIEITETMKICNDKCENIYVHVEYYFEGKSMTLIYPSSGRDLTRNNFRSTIVDYVIGKYFDKNMKIKREILSK